MSHETLAAAWTALTELQDLAAGLREAVGCYALKSVISSADNDVCAQPFCQLALELSFSFDVLRLFWDPRLHTASSLQHDLIAAVAYLTSRLGNPDSLQNLFSDDAQKHIFTYALCNAITTLRTCSWDSHVELRKTLLQHLNILAGLVSEDDDTFCLIPIMFRGLNAQFEDDVADPSPASTRVEWRDLSSLPSDQRAEIVSKIFEKATDASVSAEERIFPMLDLCRLYWDTDCILIQACGRSRRPHQLAKVLNVADEAIAIRVAMEVRFTIQEDFTMFAMGGSATPEMAQAQAYMLFRPSLRLKCLQDACNCSFDSEYAKQIGQLHSRQGKMHRMTIASAHAKSYASQLDHERIAQVLADFTNRLRRWTGTNNGLLDDPPVLSRYDDHIPEVLPLRPRLPSSKSSDGVTETKTKQGAIDSGSQFASPYTGPANRSEIARRLSRAKAPSSWSIDRRQTIDEALEAPVPDIETPMDTISDPGLMSPAMLTPPETLSPKTLSPREAERTDSLTTGTPSSNGENGSTGSNVLPAGYSTEKQIDPSLLPEAVQFLQQDSLIRSPSAFEKSYPEVAINPISSIQEDNLSLFSDGGSAPAPTLSAKQPQSKKWPGIFKTSKNNKMVANSTARFFTSGKFLIAWTKYGGACFDLNEMSEYGPFSINVGDIVLAAGGTRRFAIVARTHELYTLLVYNLGESEPGMKMSLGGCPRAMDMSRDDSFLAVKYVQVVRIFDLNNGTKIDHKLPRMDNTKSGPAGHLVSFSHDNLSFMASTRMGPERVHTYWSTCMDKNGHIVAQSTAPCGNIDDHGLSSLLVAGASARGIATGFLSTFTERGNPVLLVMSRSSPQAMPLRDTKNTVGSRIHGSAMYVDPRTRKANLVLVNQNNEVFWVTDVFGRNPDVAKLRPLKRVKSMKPEVLVAMTSPEEASIFWIDQKSQSGVHVKYGRNGGSTRSVDIRLDIEPLCCV